MRNRTERNAVGNHALVSRQHRLASLCFSMRKAAATTCARPCISYQTNRPAKDFDDRRATGMQNQRNRVMKCYNTALVSHPFVREGRVDRAPYFGMSGQR